MFYTIYKTTNKINGKIYIGKHQTKDIDDYYMGSGKYLRHAIIKYGIENFEKEILFVFDNEADMNIKEAELVTDKFVKEDTNYNLCPGGNGGFGYINSNPDIRLGFETRTDDDLKRIAKNGRDKVLEIHGDKILLWSRNANAARTKKIQKGNLDPKSFLNRTHTEETKRKISKTNSLKQSGKKNSQYGTIWITNGTTNKKITNTDLIPIGWWKGRTLRNVT